MFLNINILGNQLLVKSFITHENTLPPSICQRWLSKCPLPVFRVPVFNSRLSLSNVEQWMKAALEAEKGTFYKMFCEKISVRRPFPFCQAQVNTKKLFLWQPTY